ncbi:MAG: hypothetical protein HOO85_10555 [Methylotenera sp.]|nr:hypothetical protein [Methylotenera sp.]
MTQLGLNLPVDEKVVMSYTCKMKVCYAASDLNSKCNRHKKGRFNQALSFIQVWCAKDDEGGHWIDTVSLY